MGDRVCGSARFNEARALSTGKTYDTGLLQQFVISFNEARALSTGKIFTVKTGTAMHASLQ